MSLFQTFMLIAYLSSAWVSRENWRGLAWLAAFAASYFVASTWWNGHRPQPELVAGLLDAAIVTVIFRYGRRLWEFWLCIVAFAMLLINFLYLGHNLAALELIPHDVYATLLELLNLTALGIVGSVAAFASRGHTDGRAFNPWRTVFGLARPFAGSIPPTDAGKKD